MSDTIVDDTQRLDISAEGVDFGDKSDTESLAETLTSFELMPNAIKRRVYALKRLHHQKIQIDAKFVREFLELQKRYEPEYEPLFERRRQIVTGDYEPLDSDLLDGQAIDAVPIESAGIPDFWLKVLLSSAFDRHVEEYDEPILQHLIDIKVAVNPEKTMYSFGFHFSANDYFANDVLMKDMYFATNLEDIDILYPIKCESTEILWKPGKDVTVDRFDQNGSDGQVKTIRHNMSFFRLFWSTTADEITDIETQHLMYEWDIIRDMINTFVPNAVLFYTRELCLTSDDMNSTDGEEEEEVDEEEDDDNEDEEEGEDCEEGVEEPVEVVHRLD